MSNYAIGDIQGCYATFIHLLQSIDFNPGKDTLYLVGDTINRGPQSLNMLNWLYRNQTSVISVLGNHEIHLIARHYKLVSPGKGDTLADTLVANNIKQLIGYIKSLPLIYFDDKFTLCHAGVHPALDKNTLIKYNDIFAYYLQHNQPNYIAELYNNQISRWDSNLSVTDKVKFLVNSLTRMRYLSSLDLSLNYELKEIITPLPKDLIPWFQVKPLEPLATIVCGHWSHMGLSFQDNCIFIDSGCGWGNSLSALNLDDLTTITQVRAID